MVTSLNKWKKVLESKGYLKDGKLSEDFDGNFEDADFLPAEMADETEFVQDQEELLEDEITFEQFREAIIAEHEKMVSEIEEGEAEGVCEMLDEKQMLLAYNVCLSFCQTKPENTFEEETEDTFENEMDNEEVLEFFGKKSSKKAYQRTVDFIEGNSEEAKKIKELYENHLKGKDDSEIRKDKNLLKVMQHITALGAKWAKANKMEAADYSFKQIRTVLEGDFDRKFTGGTNVAVGESKNPDNKYKKKK